MSGEFRRTEALLGRVLPGRLVAVLLAEPRGFVAVVRWIRRAGPAGQLFPHHRDVVIILWVITTMMVLEGAVVDVLLRVILGPSPWVWIALGLHMYFVYTIVAMYAAMVTRPHSLDSAALHLRSGLGFAATVPLIAIEAADAGRFPDFDRSRWKVDEDGNATMAPREANVRLTLAPGAEITVNGRSLPTPRTIHITVDEPRRLAAAIVAVRDGAPSGLRDGTVRA